MTPTHLRQNGVTVSLERGTIAEKLRGIRNILWAIRTERRLSLGFRSDCPFHKAFRSTRRLFAYIRRLFRRAGLPTPHHYSSLLKPPQRASLQSHETGGCSPTLGALFLQASQKCTFLPLAGDTPDPNAACGREVAPALPGKGVPKLCVSPFDAHAGSSYYSRSHASPQEKICPIREQHRGHLT